jgi:putative tricarboxylic transport membrane protein
MEETQEAQDKPAVSRKTMEIAVTLLFLVFGLVVCWDSYRLGAKWGSDGPQAGYFPFYIGIIIVFCSAVTLFQALAIKAAQNTPFVMRGQLKMVTLVMVPTIIYVGLINWLGIYVASTIYIALFMWWLGKYSWVKYVPVSVGVSVSFFLMFEVWFKVPLPKGPLESALGLN